MKECLSLKKYIQESLSLDMKLNETSLLDNYDDLEKNSDKHVSITQTLMGHYNLRNVYVYGVSYFDKVLNKKEIKKLSHNYNNIIKIYAGGSNKILKNSLSKYIEILIGYIMSIDIYEEFKHLVECYEKKESQKNYHTSTFTGLKLQKEAPIMYEKLSHLFTEFSKIRILIEDDYSIKIAGERFDHINIMMIKK